MEEFNKEVFIVEDELEEESYIVISKEVLERQEGIGNLGKFEIEDEEVSRRWGYEIDREEIIKRALVEKGINCTKYKYRELLNREISNRNLRRVREILGVEDREEESRYKFR